MRFSLGRAALPFSAAALLLTAGCFRQAGEAIAPTAVGEDVIAVTRPADNAVDMVLADATEPGASAPLPLDTPPPEIVAASPTVALIILTSTPQYITPEFPLGFTTPDTPAPTVASVLDTSSLTRPAGQPTFILPSAADILATPTNLPGVEDPCIHVIQPGDTLYAIALNYGYTINDLLAVNPELGDSSAVIQPGDPLLLPLPECVDPEATADADGFVRPTSRPTPTPSPAGTPGTQIYVVRSGDVLVNIATRYGVTVTAIVQANNLTNPNSLQVGQELIIPAPAN